MCLGWGGAEKNLYITFLSNVQVFQKSIWTARMKPISISIVDENLTWSSDSSSRNLRFVQERSWNFDLTGKRRKTYIFGFDFWSRIYLKIDLKPEFQIICVLISKLSLHIEHNLLRLLHMHLKYLINIPINSNTWG